MARANGCECEASAPFAMEERREHARRVEARAAEPVDGAVGCDERRGLQIADQAVVGDGGIVRHRVVSSSERALVCASSVANVTTLYGAIAVARATGPDQCVNRIAEGRQASPSWRTCSRCSCSRSPRWSPGAAPSLQIAQLRHGEM